MEKLIFSRKKKTSPIPIILLIAGVLILGGGYFLAFVHGLYIDVEKYPVVEVLVEDDSLYFKGTTVSSGQAFSGYQYQVKDGAIYLKLRYSLVSPFNKSGEAEISVNGQFGNIEKVYLQGRAKEDKRLIWSK